MNYEQNVNCFSKIFYIFASYNLNFETMKTTIFKLQVILIVLALSVAGCNKEQTDGVKFSELDNAPKHLVSKEKLPEWLNDVVNYLESPANFVIVYKGEWNERTVYYVSDIFSSCAMCKVYFENGERIEFNISIVENFQTTSKNWVIIYHNKVPYWQ